MIAPRTAIRSWYQKVLLLSSMTLLAVCGTLSWVAYDEYQQTEDFEFRLLEAHARNANEHVRDILSQVSRLLNKSSSLWLKSDSVHRGRLSKELAQIRDDMPELGELLIADTGGVVRNATDIRLMEKNVSYEPWFRAHNEQASPSAMFMSRPEKQLQGTTSVIFSLPIVDSYGKILGVAAASIDYRFFPIAMRTINPDDKESMSVIVSRDGDLVYRRSEPEKFFGNNVTKVSVVLREHLASGKPVTRHIGPSAQNGKTRLFVVQDVDDSGLCLILSRQLDEVLAVWLRNVAIYLLICVATVGALAVLLLSARRRKQLETEIAASHEQLRLIEQQQILSQERQRLIQDMHDGLGSSLMSTLKAVEHGEMDRAAIADLLRSCIDDLKLTIDSMEPTEADLLALLAALRYRLGPRIEGTGITLHWKVTDLPPLEWLTPRYSLHILRILQEAFTNIMKHSCASEISIETRAADDGYVEVIITDNGRGFDLAEAAHGRGKGLMNQRRRAQVLGGQVVWNCSNTGTILTLRLPRIRPDTE